MQLRTVPRRLVERTAGAGRALGRATRRFAYGFPTGFVAALAALVLVAILYTVAVREPKETRAYAELTLFPQGCAIEMTRQLNAQGCTRVARGVYRLSFTESLEGSTPVASRGSCCPGRIAASVETDNAVLLVVPPRFRSPVRASVVLP